MSEHVSTMSPPRKRASATRVPEWWLSHLVETVRACGLSRAELGEQLAHAAGRSRPWSAMTVWRFLRGENVTDELADAFQALFDLPPYAFFPRDLADAAAMRALQSQRASTTVASNEASTTLAFPTTDIAPFR